MPFYDPHPPATLARNFKGYVVVNLLHIAFTANSVLDLDERYRNILLIQWSVKLEKNELATLLAFSHTKQPKQGS